MGLNVAAMVTGAAIGALVTYITKDESARNTMSRFMDGTGDAFMTFLKRITPEKKAEVQEKMAAEAGEAEAKAPEKAAAAPPKEEPTVASEEAVH